MSAGDVRVLRHEAAGGESPRMPAWKREILERRKAKGGGAGAGVAESSSARVNGEVGADSGEAAQKESLPSRSHHLQSMSPEMSPVKTKKEPWSESGSLDQDDGECTEQERLVLQDSLGPLQENPFIKLEKERKRRQDSCMSRPVQHILELYSNVPGIRTIRAENIIIIESDPDYFPAKGSLRLQPNGTVGSYSSLNDLMERQGHGVTEIRAKEVVVYDSSLSKSEENLSTLGRRGAEGSSGLTDGQGRVSRMLQKFDRNFGKLQPKSHSTENLLDLDDSPVRPRPRHLLRSDLVPKPKAAQLESDPSTTSHLVFQDAQDSNLDGSPPSVSSFRRRFEAGGPLRIPPASPKRKVPCSPEKPPSSADSPSPPTSPPSPGFEFHPSPRPDLSSLPAGDIQARALANLRLQSRNSFTVIPRRRGPISSPGNTAPPSPVRSPPSPEPPDPVPTRVMPPPTPPPSKKHDGERLSRHAKVEPSRLPSPDPLDSLPPPAEHLPEPSLQILPKDSDRLPVTNIDDIELEPSRATASPALQRRSGNTFTVVPKRRPDTQPTSEPLEPPAVTQAGPAAPQAPYSQLSTLLKKRYPAVEEIEVIGGYLSLGRSCLSKTGSTGKKLNISFNESSLHSTFEYPSESSVWDSEDEDDKDREEEDDDETGKGEGGAIGERFSIPRPSYTSSPAQTYTTDLSNYTPKNAVDFSTWQEHKQDDSLMLADSSSGHGESSTEDVMLTPADSSSLSDFSSEPALYF